VQEILQLKDKMQTVEDDITSANIQLRAESVPSKKYVTSSSTLNIS